nr:iron-containing alcohol dehydrogenase [Endozoicomonas euniceicola]
MMDFEQYTANWHYPTTVRTGAGRIRELPDICREKAITNPLIITDPGLANLPFLKNAAEHCGTELAGCSVFSAIKANPTGENIDAGVVAYQKNNHDGVIAFGGGSALDAGKAVALMAGQDRPLWDFEDVGDNYLRANTATMAPVIAVPTTAGTGSEVGRASVITHQQDQIKKIIFHPNMLPETVILDPELTCGLPAAITAATGIDALSHNLEAYCSPLYHPMAKGIAVEGIRLIKDFLPVAVSRGDDIEARTQMLVASTMGATAFQKGLGAMHALAHPLGAIYDAHHGLLNAILMPYVLKANESVISDDIARLSRYLDLPEPGFPAFFEWVMTLRQQCNIPHRLAEIGIDDTHSERIGKMACDDPSAGTNPIAFSASDYEKIFAAAIQGNV